jgi:hypothetical protein
MGDRKVTNKYIPADFDPKLIPRGKKLSAKDGTVPVRMMLPFSIQCSTCNTFMYRGRKFNSKKEPVGGSEGRYLGIQRWRFYIKCTHCSRPVTFLTDPKNADYEMESGASRNYEVYKDKEQTEETAAADKEQEETEDPMKALENRVLDSQREMADLDNLEEIKAMNARHAKLGAGTEGFGAEADAILRLREAKAAADMEHSDVLTAEDEALVQSIQFGKKTKEIRRLDEEDERQHEQKRKEESRLLEEQQRKQMQKNVAPKPAVKFIKAKRRRIVSDERGKKDEADSLPKKGGGLSDLLGGYGSESDSD